MYADNEADGTFIQRCLAGDTSAFEPLVERYHRPLFNLAARLLGDRDAALKATQTAVQAALLALSDEQREVVLLRHFTELSYDEIATSLELPVRTVKSRLYSARQRLASLLADRNLVWRTTTTNSTTRSTRRSTPR